MVRNAPLVANTPMFGSIGKCTDSATYRPLIRLRVHPALPKSADDTCSGTSVSTTTEADTVNDRDCPSTLVRRRSAHSSARRTPVVAATRIARACSGRDDSAATISRRISSGVGTTGATSAATVARPTGPGWCPASPIGTAE
jgi:hypothetical protein